MGWTAWALVGAVIVVVAVVVTAALLVMVTALALAMPARRSGALRTALAGAGLDGSRRGTWEAYVTWRRAFLPTSSGWRRLQMVLGVVTMPIIFGSTRWRPRSALLTASGACLRVDWRRDGSWKLVDVAGWPVGSRRARPLLERLVAGADAAGVTVKLRASTLQVAEEVYAAVGFQRVGRSLHMVRVPASDDAHSAFPANAVGYHRARSTA